MVSVIPVQILGRESMKFFLMNFQLFKKNCDIYNYFLGE